LWDSEQGEWLERLVAEHDNMRVALSWAIEREDAELGLRFAAAMRWFWYARGHYGEGRGWLEQALAMGGQARAATRARALDALGWLAHDQGDMDRAVAVAEEGLKLGKNAQIEDNCTASFQNMLGEAARHRGDYERASELFAVGLSLYRQVGDRRGIAWSLGNLANVSSDLGDYERAVNLYEEGLALCRELGGAQPLGDYLSSWGTNSCSKATTSEQRHSTKKPRRCCVIRGTGAASSMLSTSWDGRRLCEGTVSAPKLCTKKASRCAGN
jgi:tetratricopeptide (TPR) repeat protein